MKKLVLGIAISTFSVLFVSSCATADDNWVSLSHTGGEELFAEKCGMCHRARGMGTGILGRRMSPEIAELEDREDLQGVYIEAVVRNGLNTMFPISRAEVSDPQLKEIAQYLSMGDQ